MGGDHVEYEGNVSTKTADIVMAKLLFNSIVSTPNGCCMIGDLKDFYLGTPMQPQDYVYMQIPVAMLPPDIMDHYQLHDLVHNGHIYVEIWHGMYGLPQASWLANLQLQAFLKLHGYHPCPITHELWTHDEQPIHFTLVVDDFVIHYTDKKDVDHLMAALWEHYQVTEDWTATWYCGITLAWDYTARMVDLSMPGYIDWALKWFQHPHP